MCTIHVGHDQPAVCLNMADNDGLLLSSLLLLLKPDVDGCGSAAAGVDLLPGFAVSQQGHFNCASLFCTMHVGQFHVPADVVLNTDDSGGSFWSSLAVVLLAAESPSTSMTLPVVLSCVAGDTALLLPSTSITPPFCS